MQATIATHDPVTRGGSVLFDDGVLVAFGPAAVDPRLRVLRPGQRVRVHIEGSTGPMRVIWLTLSTFDAAGAPGG